MAMPMPVTTEAHRLLARLVGTWVGEERVHPSPFDPQGGVAEARVENRLALDGFNVIQDYTQSRHGRVSLRGHGVFGWDPAEHCYVLWWWDSQGAGPNVFRGQWEGDVLVLSATAPGMASRSEWHLGEDGYTFRMEVSPDGDRWTTFLDGSYRRQT